MEREGCPNAKSGWTPDWLDVLGWAREAGFPLAGVSPAQAPAEAVRSLDRWIADGRCGSLAYMGETAGVRADASLWLPWARSILSVALPYNTRRDESADWVSRGHFWVSRYAWGRDYHRVVKARLAPLLLRLKSLGVRARACVDSSPLIEKAHAAGAGLGFLGKNTLLVHPGLGSYLFLGEVVTDLEPPREPPEPVSGGCGACDLCVVACPAGALDGAGGLDARACLSAWTVEHEEPPREPPDPRGHIFGCDRCQEVCPHNRRAPLSGEADFQPRPPWFAPGPEDILGLSEETWNVATRGMAIRRHGFEGLIRSARRAAGSGSFRPVPGCGPGDEVMR